MNRINNEWLLPTLAGMAVATLRRFRRQRNEPLKVVLIRFLAHTTTCVIAGYIAGGLLGYAHLPNLVAPGCALAGLYGTMLVDWVEQTGFALFTNRLKKRLSDE